MPSIAYNPVSSHLDFSMLYVYISHILSDEIFLWNVIRYINSVFVCVNGINPNMRMSKRVPSDLC